MHGPRTISFVVVALARVHLSTRLNLTSVRSKPLCQINAGRIRAVACKSTCGRRGYAGGAVVVGNTQASVFNSASP